MNFNTLQEEKISKKAFIQMFKDFQKTNNNYDLKFIKALNFDLMDYSLKHKIHGKKWSTIADHYDVYV